MTKPFKKGDYVEYTSERQVHICRVTKIYYRSPSDQWIEIQFCRYGSHSAVFQHTVKRLDMRRTENKVKVAATLLQR